MKRGRKKKKTVGTELELIRFGISIPADLLRKFDQYLADRSKQNRSDAIRDLIRERLVQEQWSEGKGEQVATVTLVYDGQALRGPASAIRNEAESIRALKGVLHGQVVFTTPNAP